MWISWPRFFRMRASARSALCVSSDNPLQVRNLRSYLQIANTIIRKSPDMRQPMHFFLAAFAHPFCAPNASCAFFCAFAGAASSSVHVAPTVSVPFPDQYSLSIRDLHNPVVHQPDVYHAPPPLLGVVDSLIPQSSAYSSAQCVVG
jgi:hypothetical protein